MMAHRQSDEERRDRIRIHAALVLAGVVCPGAFGFELWRALAGNHLSWVYVVEWPLLLVVSVYLWRAMLTERSRPSAAAADISAGVERPESRACDPDLAAWHRYLEELDASEAPDGSGRDG